MSQLNTINQRSDLHVATTSSTNLSLSVLALGMLRWTRLALAWSWANHVLKIACRVKTTTTRVRKTWQNKTVRMKCCSLTKNTHKEQPLKRFHGYALDVHVNVSILLHAFFWCKIHRTWCNKSSRNPMLARPSCNMIPRIQVPQDRREKTTSPMFWHAWCMPWQGIWSGESCTSASNESKMIYTVYTPGKNSGITSRIQNK